MAESVSILGVRVHNVTQREALLRMKAFLRSGRGRHVVTVNPEFLVQAQADPAFRELLNTADLALPDGVGLLWASRHLGRPLRGRVTGVDTVRHLAQLAAEKGYRIFFLGAGPGVAAKAAAVLAQENPGLTVAGTFSGSPQPRDEPEILSLLHRASPHILLVAFGAPEQDKWIRRNLGASGVRVAMGVGGAFDFLSGRVRRAPPWVQRVGLEWLYRLLQEPWRWRRMLRLLRFIYLVFRAPRGAQASLTADRPQS